MNKEHYIKWFKDNGWPQTADHIEKDNIELLSIWAKSEQVRPLNSHYLDILNNYLRSHKLSLIEQT